MVNSNKKVKLIESAVLNLCMFTLFSIDGGGGVRFLFVFSSLMFFCFSYFFVVVRGLFRGNICHLKTMLLLGLLLLILYHILDHFTKQCITDQVADESERFQPRSASVLFFKQNYNKRSYMQEEGCLSSVVILNVGL